MAVHLQVFIAAVIITFAVAWQHSDDMKDFITIMNILNKPRVPEYRKLGQSLSTKAFSWTNCGHSGDLVTIGDIKLDQDHIKIPGNVTFSGAGKVNSVIKAPLSVSLKIQKKIYVWIDIPCIDDIGSCQYDDVCDMLAQITCPPELPIDCHCPYKPGPLDVTNATLFVDPEGIPSWLTEGDYKIDVKAHDGGKEVLCMNIELTLG